jgi:hypothetical protein
MNEREMVIRQLADVFLDPEDVMERPVRSLGGFSPNECLEAGRIEDVLDWIDQLRSGAFI